MSMPNNDPYRYLCLQGHIYYKWKLPVLMEKRGWGCPEHHFSAQVHSIPVGMGQQRWWIWWIFNICGILSIHKHIELIKWKFAGRGSSCYIQWLYAPFEILLFQQVRSVGKLLGKAGGCLMWELLEEHSTVVSLQQGTSPSMQISPHIDLLCIVTSTQPHSLIFILRRGLLKGHIAPFVSAVQLIKIAA